MSGEPQPGAPDEKTAELAEDLDESLPRSSPVRLDGDVDAMVGWEPDFRIAWRGYDTLQVDNYVAWATTELISTRASLERALRASNDVAARLGATELQLEQVKERLADASSAPATHASERVREILHLAAQEADELRSSARATADEALAAAQAAAEQMRTDAEQALAEATKKASQMLRDAEAEAERVRAKSRQDVERLLKEADRARAEADAAALGQRQKADRLAEQKRQRENREAATRLAQLNDQCAEVSARRDAILADLQQLHERLGAALHAAEQAMRSDKD